MIPEPRLLHRVSAAAAPFQRALAKARTRWLTAQKRCFCPMPQCWLQKALASKPVEKQKAKRNPASVTAD